MVYLFASGSIGNYGVESSLPFYTALSGQLKIVWAFATRWSSVLAFCLLWLTAMPVAAATLVVNSNADTTGTAGICTLRDAITAANTDAVKAGCVAGSGTDTITFASSLSGQTITLTSLLPQLTSDITIDGTSLASHVQISGNNAYQVFSIASGTTVILTHLDIINGEVPLYYYDGGGGIGNYGTLTVNNSTFSGNNSRYYSPGGGGIASYGILTINSSTFSGNSADIGNGGGIYSDGTLTVNSSTFSGFGHWVPNGGGIYSNGTLTVNSSTFSDNSNYQGGGGIHSVGTLTVDNSTFVDNNSYSGLDLLGGGIYSDGTLTVNSSTFSDNWAMYGGGIYSDGTLTVSSSTFSGNSGEWGGGGIFSHCGTLTVNSSTFSGNSTYFGDNAADGGGIVHYWCYDTLSTTTMNVDNSTFSGNSGGGILSSGGILIVNNSTFLDNVRGGITVWGESTVDNSTFSSNSGGGICSSGTLTVNSSTFSGNSSPEDGGGIRSSGILIVNNSTFSGNSSPEDGGGIQSSYGILTINSSTFSGNSSVWKGGGIASYGGGTVDNSTFSSNSAGWGSGGIHSESTTLIVDNSTFSGNTVTPPGDVTLPNDLPWFWNSGSISNYGTLTVNNSTFSGNQSGIYNCSWCDTTFTLNNSILANSTTSSPDCYADSESTTFTGNNNLIMNNAGCGTPTLTADPLLGPLANNGGSTQTFALLAGSPAIDAGDDATCLTTDQNGVTRPQGTHCDIGAYEYYDRPIYSSTPAPASTIDIGTVTVGSSMSKTLSISETGTAQLDITNLALSGTDMAEFSISPTTAFSIADGDAAQTVTLTCTPTTEGAKTATLTVTHNAVDSPATYTLTCTGTALPTYSVTLATAGMGTVTGGNSYLAGATVQYH